jgi:tartrate-resistant acid phosphatase type 5
MITMIRSIAVFLLVGASFASLHSQSLNPSPNQLTLGSTSLNFLVISDWGREGINDSTKKTPGQLKVAKQFGATAKDVNASFVVTCGDNFHGKGVSSSTDPLWRANFENVYTGESLMIPWYITLGNHDYEGNVEAELEYAKASQRWTQPARYYSFTRRLPDSTEILFVVIDSSPFVEEYINEKGDGHHVRGQDTGRQLQWCDSVLSESSALWKFAFFHHPAYSASSKHGSTVEIQNTLVPLFEKYHVDACFSGHDHDLQHSHPDNAHVEYFGNGGGSETRPAGHAAFTKFSQASLGFGVVSLTQSTLRFSFVNEKGEQVYTYEIHK